MHGDIAQYNVQEKGERESQPSGVEWQGHILATPRRTKAPKKVTPRLPR